METPPIHYDHFCGTLTRGEVSVRLSEGQNRVFRAVADGRGQVVTLNRITNQVWITKGPENPWEVIKVQVCHIRRKLTDAGLDRCIETDWGRGLYVAPYVQTTLGQVVLSTHAQRLLRRMIETHPNATLVDHVRQAVFG